jgi:hypothetical protein
MDDLGVPLFQETTIFLSEFAHFKSKKSQITSLFFVSNDIVDQLMFIHTQVNMVMGQNPGALT